MILYDDIEVNEKIKVYDRGVDFTSREGEHQVRIAYCLGEMWALYAELTDEQIRTVSGGIREILNGRG